MTRSQIFILWVVLLCYTIQGYSQVSPLDSVSVVNPVPVTTKKSFWDSKAVHISKVPVMFFAASAATWGVRQEVRKLRNEYIPSFENHFDNYTQYLPAVATFGLNAAGVKGRSTMKRAFVSYVFSAAIMGVLVNGIKYTAKVERPDGSSNNSFPSGHTANSFMNATFLHKEYGQYRSPLYSVAGYTTATATAIGRQLNNRHWVSDVLAGAGIGILSTELGYIIADKIFKDKGANPVLHRDPIPINHKPSFIEMRLGYAFATDKDLTNTTDDLYTKGGFNLGIEGAWFFHKNIGIGGEFAFTSFPVNDDNLVLTDPDANLVSDGNYYTTPMGVRYLTAGPYFSFPLPRNWFITSKINVGSSTGATGNVMLEITEDYQDLLQTTELAYLKYKPETAFAWTAGLGIQKRISRNVAIKAYGSYFNSDHDFDLSVIDNVDANGNFNYRQIGTQKVKFDHLAFGLGLTAFLW